MNLDFFTPISFNTPNLSTRETILETCDNYFYRGGEIATVIPGYTENNSLGVVISNEETNSLLSTALKIASYLTIIIPLVMLAVKTVMRFQYQFHLINFEKELQKGIELDDSKISKIKKLLRLVLSASDNPEIQWHSKGSTLVFSLSSCPDLVFKIANPGRSGPSIHGRYLNMEEATKVCIENQLSHLVVPHAKEYLIEGTLILAEEQMDIEHDEGLQEDLYRELSDNFETTAKELVTFIAKTGFCDIEWRNIPLLNSTSDPSLKNRVALIDLEHFGDPKLGIYGGYPNRRGLIRCLPTSPLMRVALNDAHELGIIADHLDAERLIQERVKEVKLDKRLEPFLGNQRTLDLGNLPLQLKDRVGKIQIGSQSKDITMWEAAVDIVDHINTALEKNSTNKSLKSKHYVHIDINDKLLMQYYYLGAKKPGKFLIDENDMKNSWLFKILNSLHKNNYIIMDRTDNSGYYIYANRLTLS